MKKIVLLIAVAILYGCSTPAKLVERYNFPESGRVISVERFNLEGHDWLCFTWAPFNTYNYYTFSIEHDPNCKKCVKISENNSEKFGEFKNNSYLRNQNVF
jgi:hypothetical protein